MDEPAQGERWGSSQMREVDPFARERVKKALGGKLNENLWRKIYFFRWRAFDHAQAQRDDPLARRCLDVRAQLQHHLDAITRLYSEETDIWEAVTDGTQVTNLDWEDLGGRISAAAGALRVFAPVRSTASQDNGVSKRYARDAIPNDALLDLRDALVAILKEHGVAVSGRNSKLNAVLHALAGRDGETLEQFRSRIEKLRENRKR